MCLKPRISALAEPCGSEAGTSPLFWDSSSKSDQNAAAFTRILHVHRVAASAVQYAMTSDYPAPGYCT